ncbi:hypothetical protein [Nocardioides psychrotolerans]|uniref:hypothetical protein n=1 Tax=Nocardioides psychrotolerans TaxID=1005945 RepID=UPI0031383993
MSAHENARITRLLEQGSDGLQPDVAGIVERGRERGRRRVRRARIGASLAAAAVVGVVAVSAAVVPSLLDEARTVESGFADGPSDDGLASDLPAQEPSTEVSIGPGEVAPARLSMKAAEIPELVRSLYPGEVVEIEDLGGFRDSAEGPVAHFSWDGFATSAGANRPRVKGDTPLEICRASGSADMSCRERADGSAVLTWLQEGPAVDGGVTGRGVSVFTPGWEVWVVSYNASEGKDAPVLADEPPFTFAQLEAIGSDPAWFD